MKKGVKNNKMTIEKLALIVAKGFDGIEARMATKEDLASLEKRMDTKMVKLETKMATKEDLKIQQDITQIMLKEINAIHTDTKSIRADVSTLYSDNMSYDRKIDNLTMRVEKLEMKK